MQFALQPAGASDSGFLYRLFESTRGRQFAQLPLVPSQVEALVRLQFNTQQAAYRMQYPESQDFVIVSGDRSAGRLWLNESADEILIVDIAIAPESQGRGLGTSVLRQIIDDASLAAKAVRLHVDRMNFRAARLYRGLGFKAVSNNEVYEEMELLPGRNGAGIPIGSG